MAAPSNQVKRRIEHVNAALQKIVYSNKDLVDNICIRYGIFSNYGPNKRLWVVRGDIDNMEKALATLMQSPIGPADVWSFFDKANVQIIGIQASDVPHLKLPISRLAFEKATESSVLLHCQYVYNAVSGTFYAYTMVLAKKQ